MFRTGKLRRWGAAFRGAPQDRTEGGRRSEPPPEQDGRRVIAQFAFAGPLVRTRPDAGPVRQRWCRLDGDPEAVRTARGLVGNALREWGRADLVDDATLVVSELVTNALVHGAPPVTVTVVYESVLVIEVADSCRDLPIKQLPGSGGHFGMWLAEELCDLSVRPRPDGKTVRAVFTATPMAADHDGERKVGG
jgi:anti-sigma regulatory factor (Ser/Thr protein kinase)